MEQFCSLCSYFFQSEKEIEEGKPVGECRRHPPQIVNGMANIRPMHARRVHMASKELELVTEGFQVAPSNHSQFVKVMKDWGCGEFKATEKPN